MKNALMIFFLFIVSKFFAQDTIQANQASNFMDKTMFIKGKVVSFKAAKDGRTTNYLNIDSPYPNAIFTVVLTNRYLNEKSIRIEDLDQKNICVLGKITTYKEDPKKIPQVFNPENIVVLIKQ